MIGSEACCLCTFSRCVQLRSIYKYKIFKRAIHVVQSHHSVMFILLANPYAVELLSFAESASDRAGVAGNFFTSKPRTTSFWCISMELIRALEAEPTSLV